MRFRTPRALGLLAVLAGLTLVTPTSPVDAATRTVSVADFAFSPSSVQISQGGSVTWQFHAEHTTTSNQHFWDSEHKTSGSYVVAFPDAGNYGYFCEMHPSMTGVVRVPLKSTGKSSTGYQVTWSTRTSTPANRRFDVQYKKSGAAHWTSWRSSSAGRSAKFNPAHSGTYLVRARTHNGTHGASGWTSSLSLKIT